MKFPGRHAARTTRLEGIRLTSPPPRHLGPGAPVPGTDLVQCTSRDQVGQHVSDRQEEALNNEQCVSNSACLFMPPPYTRVLCGCHGLNITGPNALDDGLYLYRSPRVWCGVFTFHSCGILTSSLENLVFIQSLSPETRDSDLSTGARCSSSGVIRRRASHSNQSQKQFAETAIEENRQTAHALATVAGQSTL